MNQDGKTQRPAAKSKTDLRRGQFTPGIERPKQAIAPRGTAGTSRDEEAMLFGEPPDESTSR
ncbi:MAG: hypothetical protein ACAI37_06220 [Chthoniobacter sp.]